MKNLIKIFLTFSIFFSFSSVWALDSTISGKIVDNFKSRHEEILFETLPTSATVANEILETEYRLNGLESLKNKLQTIETYYVQKKEETTSKRLTLEEAIKAIDNSIAFTQSWIIETNNSITQKIQKIQTLERASIDLKKRIVDHKKIILSYVANVYSEGNIIYDNEGEVDVMKAMILSEENVDYYFQDITYKTIISQLWQKFVEEYRATVREYYVNSVKTNEEKKNLEDLKSSLERQKATLEAQKKEREHILEITKWQEQLYIQYIASQKQAQEQVANAWKKANDDYQKSFDNFMKENNCTNETMTPECIRLRQFFINEKELAKSEYSSWTQNILLWPTDSRRVTAYFRDQDYYKLVGSHHDAMDIWTPQWSNVYAVADGYVYYIVEPTTTSYSYVAIRHKWWIVSVYWHLSKVNISPYQFVRAGEIIAQSGGAPGTPGAGPVSTGPHLHFEIWKNREAQDPLRFISTADIDYKNLPSLYQTKFLTDIVEKTWTGTNLSAYSIKFKLKWDTEEERQKYLLSTYATPDFKNWNLWTDVAISHKIDPSFLMCIGLAETTLGNYLKTPYNIWNVWNTDSWDTITFSSPKEWITWMAKTFNNKYLWKYTKISELSRWWNQKWPIYASSTANWHNNTVKCLTALKWQFVENDFNFRLSSDK